MRTGLFRRSLIAISAVIVLASAAVIGHVTQPKTFRAAPLYGVTIDDPWNTAPTSVSFQALAHRPTARIVFDENVAAEEYREPVSELKMHADLMGGILDSAYVKQYSVSAFKDRTNDYLKTLGGSIKIWEVCNECNGEWLGETPNVVAKMTYAYDAVKRRRGSTALTLHYNLSCCSDLSREMFTWANENVPPRMKTGLDFVFISYYEDDCSGPRPDWQAIFDRLGEMFPNSKIGFGEVGTKKPDKKAEYLGRYYRMHINHPRYVGGYFWYYFSEDMVPNTKPLLTVLNNAMQ